MSPGSSSSRDERAPLLSQSVPSSPRPGAATPATTPAFARTPATPPTSSSSPPFRSGSPRNPSSSSWPPPAGLPIRGSNDENLVIFRHAVGINFALPSADDGPTLEEGRKTATGIYKSVLRLQKRKAREHRAFNVLLYVCHVLQILLGAVLTALGPAAAKHTLLITLLGASNTVVAGLLALLKGQGLPERLRRDQIGYRKLQDWIEETEKLLAVGIIGRDRKEVGLLVEMAFKKYNAAKASEVNNRPDSYVRQREEGLDDGDDPDDWKSNGSGNAIVRLGLS